MNTHIPGKLPPRFNIFPAKTPRSVFRYSPLPLLAVLVLIFAVLIGGGLYFITASPVTLEFEGRTFTLRTHGSTVGAMFDELALMLDPEDIINPQREASIRPGLRITVDKAIPVAVAVDGKLTRVRTHSTNPRHILQQAGIALDDDDQVLADSKPISREPLTHIPQAIQVVRTITVTLVDGDKSTILNTSAHTVGEALDEAGVDLFVADKIEPDAATALKDGDTIRISRSTQVYIEADSKRLTTRTQGKTVADALADSGMAPVGLDYVVPAEATALEADMTIRLVRVTEDIVVAQQEVRFRTITRTDPSLAVGEQRVIQRGETGLIETRTRVRRENGVEVSQTVESTITFKEAVDEIIAVGPSMPLDDGARG